VTGVRSVGRVVGVLTALVVLLVAPALLTAVDGAAGMRVSAPYPLELIAFGSGLFADGLGRGLLAVVLAAVIGGAGTALLRQRRR
jgi:iron complex transport system permease protein